VLLLATAQRVAPQVQLMAAHRAADLVVHRVAVAPALPALAAKARELPARALAVVAKAAVERRSMANAPCKQGAARRDLLRIFDLPAPVLF
jgi:hypothetical protein